MTWLFTAYAVVWVALFLYVFGLDRKIRDDVEHLLKVSVAVRPPRLRTERFTQETSGLVQRVVEYTELQMC